MNDEWVSVKDKLPYAMEEVIIFCSDGTFRVAWWDGLSWISNREEIERYDNVTVTHWMAFDLEPPKEHDNE